MSTRGRVVPVVEFSPVSRQSSSYSRAYSARALMNVGRPRPPATMSSPQTAANARSCLRTAGICDHSFPAVASVASARAARRLDGESSA